MPQRTVCLKSEFPLPTNSIAYFNRKQWYGQVDQQTPRILNYSSWNHKVLQWTDTNTNIENTCRHFQQFMSIIHSILTDHERLWNIEFSMINNTMVNFISRENCEKTAIVGAGLIRSRLYTHARDFNLLSATLLYELMNLSRIILESITAENLEARTLSHIRHKDAKLPGAFVKMIPSRLGPKLRDCSSQQSNFCCTATFKPSCFCLAATLLC